MPSSNPGIEPVSLMSPALAGEFFITTATWEAHMGMCVCVCMCVLFLVLFLYRILQDIDYSYLCHTVCPRWLSILYIVLCIC